MDITSNFLAEHTEYNRLTNYTHCNVLKDGVKCKSKFHGRNVFNVKRHMRTHHPYLLNNFPQVEDEKKYSLRVTTTVRNFVQACIEQVTIDGRPLVALHDNGFARLFDMVCEIKWQFFF